MPELKRKLVTELKRKLFSSRKCRNCISGRSINCFRKKTLLYANKVCAWMCWSCKGIRAQTHLFFSFSEMHCLFFRQDFLTVIEPCKSLQGLIQGSLQFLCLTHARLPPESLHPQNSFLSLRWCIDASGKPVSLKHRQRIVSVSALVRWRIDFPGIAEIP